MGESTCTQQGCHSPAYCRGLCQRHYGRMYRTSQLPPVQQELPLGRHSLLTVNITDGTGHCAVCGPVKIRIRKGRRGHVECAVGSRARKGRGKSRGTPEARRRYAIQYELKRKYNLTPAMRQKMVAAQQGRCAICGEVPDGPLCVDHCHETGRVRGLLCRACNWALGHLRDDRESLRNAIDYLS